MYIYIHRERERDYTHTHLNLLFLAGGGGLKMWGVPKGIPGTQQNINCILLFH